MNGHANSIRPVLPDPDRGWPPHDAPGRKSIHEQSIVDILLPRDALEPEGVPAIFARQFRFQWALGLDPRMPAQAEARAQLETLVRAAFLGVLEVAQIPLERLGVFGELLRQDPKRMRKTHIVLYSWNGRVVAVADDPTFLFPSPNLTLDDIAAIDVAISELLTDYVRRVDAHERQNLETRAAWIFDAWAAKMSGGTVVENEEARRIVTDLARRWVGARSIAPPNVPHLLQSTPDGSVIPQFIGHILYCPTCDRNLLDIQQAEIPIIHGDAPAIPCACGNRHAWEDVLPDGLTLLPRGGRKEFLIWNDPDRKMPRFVRAHFDTTQGQATYHIGKFVVVVRGTILRPEDTLVPHVVRLGPSGQNRLPDFPFRREYLEIVKSCECTQRAGMTVSYKFRLKGMTTEKRVTLPVSVTSRKDSYDIRLTLWPKFRLKGWRLHYALFTHEALYDYRPRMWLVSRDFASAEYVSDLPTRPGDVVRSVPARRLEFIPHIFGMEWEGPDQKDVETGYYVIPDEYRPEILKLEDVSRKIAVDFGTSNTYVAVETAKGSETPGYQELSYDAFTGALLAVDDAARTSVENSRRWLCFTRFSPAPQIFPSELVFHRQDIQIDDLDRPLDGFATRNPRISYLLPQQVAGASYDAAEADRAVRRRYVTNFKWMLTDDLYGWDRKRFVVQYLIGVLELVVASLVARDHCGSVSAIVTYPLAFERTKRDDYEDAWVAIRNSIQEITGVALTGERMIDESRAGAMGSAGTADNSRHIVVDVGGGTTDIAFFLNPGKLFFIDSLRFGGDDLVEILADENAMPSTAKSTWNTIRRGLENLAVGHEHLQNRIDEMLRMALTREWIQSDSAERGFSRWIGGQSDKSAREILERAVNHFFNGILEYVSALIRGWDSFDGGEYTRDIHVHALGNGWRMWRGISSLDAIYPDIESSLYTRMNGTPPYRISVSGPSDRSLNTKATTAIGALRAFQTGEVKPMATQWPLSPKSGVCSIVGFPVRIGDRELREEDRVPATIETTSATVSVDLAYLRARFRNCEEFLHIDERMAQQFGSDISAYLDTASPGKAILYESPLKIFLTQYYLPHLKRHFRDVAIRGV